ncbi:MAG: TIGR04283 family arsenosugar biosynthesis glycosyltransferase, partial [Roseiflexaceae bacterium]|nr:TIGR04283 family arsenosugar biosynthesis glycosyltransferase [Roseiflexaceae bacterium]
EIIVADGGSTDATVALASPFARVVHAPRGRARQMNAGAFQAQGDVLLFLHADTRLPPHAGERIALALRDPAVVAGGWALRFDAPGWLYELIARSTNLRSRLRHIFTGDQAIFVRADVFHALGGFADIPLMEDLEIWARLGAAGCVALLTPPVLVSARRHRRYGPLRVLATGWLYQLLYALGMPPFGLYRLYYGRPPE